MEVSPDGNGFREVTRLNLTNLQSLIKMFKKFTDIKMAEDLPHLKRPKLKNDEYTRVSIEATEAFKEFKKELLARAEAAHNGEVEPIEDNFLKIVSDFRKASLDMRLIDPSISEAEAGGKIDAICDSVFAKFKETEDVKGTQLIFSDLSTPKGKKDGEDEFSNDDESSEQTTKDDISIYERIKKGLVKRGIPASQIAFVHEAKNATQRQALFDRVNEGDIRVIIGSTSKMGAGTNFQKHLVALHHLDCPWRPRDVEQREGRILRSGNLNEEVEIFTYTTKGSYDANMWEKVAKKAAMIDALMRGDPTINELEDISKMSADFQEIASTAYENPLMSEQAKISSQVRRLQHSKYLFNRRMSDYKFEMRRYEKEISVLERRIENLKADIEARKKTSGDNFRMKIGDKIFTKFNEAKKEFNSTIQKFKNLSPTKIGEIGGFDIKARTEFTQTMNGGVVEVVGKRVFLTLENHGSYSVDSSLSVIQNFINKRIEEDLTANEENLKSDIESVAELKKIINEPFDKQAELDEAEKRLEEIQSQLSKDKADKILSETFEEEGTENISAENSEAKNNITDSSAETVVNDENLESQLDSIRRDWFDLSKLEENQRIDPKSKAKNLQKFVQEKIITPPEAVKLFNDLLNGNKNESMTAQKRYDELFDSLVEQLKRDVEKKNDQYGKITEKFPELKKDVDDIIAEIKNSDNHESILARKQTLDDYLKGYKEFGGEYTQYGDEGNARRVFEKLDKQWRDVHGKEINKIFSETIFGGKSTNEKLSQTNDLIHKLEKNALEGKISWTEAMNQFRDIIKHDPQIQLLNASNKISPIKNTSQSEQDSKENSVETPFAKIIQEINSEYGTNFKNAEKILEKILTEFKSDKKAVKTAKENDANMFRKAYGYDEYFVDSLFDNLRGKDAEFERLVLNNSDVVETLKEKMFPIIYENLISDAEDSVETSAQDKFEVGEFTHTQTGKKMQSAKLNDKVERDEYLKLNALAKKHGGGYSRFAKHFIFDTAEKRDAFVRESIGGTSNIKFAGKGDLEKMFAARKEISDDKLKSWQKKWVELGEDTGVKVVWIDAHKDLNGAVQDGTIYINRRANDNPTKTFWHETFHLISELNPELHQDLLEYFTDKNKFTAEQLENYRRENNREDLTDAEIIEEILSDNFGQIQKRARLMQEILLWQQ